jgi:hypothetical protein
MIIEKITKIDNMIQYNINGNAKSLVFIFNCCLLTSIILTLSVELPLLPCTT